MIIAELDNTGLPGLSRGLSNNGFSELTRGASHLLVSFEIRMFIKTPLSPIENWLLTWIAIPILALMLIFLVVSFWSGQNKCKSLCRDKGYKQSKYIAPYRFNDGKCICEEPVNAGSSDQKLQLTIQ